MSWRVASSLSKLFAQVDAQAPRRGKRSDGTVGDPSHQGRNSDHNPWVLDGRTGVVTAADVTHDPGRGCDCHELRRSLIESRDPRIKYVIFDGQMWRSYDKPGKPAWSADPYRGPNPHRHHLHLSVNPEKARYDDASPWPIRVAAGAAAPIVVAGQRVAGDAPLAWGARVDAPFRARAREIAGTLQVDPSALMAVMAFETGRTFAADKRNPASGATGLIQFMPKTAEGLGTTCEELASITPFEQLVFVLRHLRPWAGRMKDVYDLYMAVLWPAAVDKPLGHVLFAEPTRAYRLNRGLDANDDGAVTKAEAADKVVRILVEGLRRENAWEGA